jgi:phosphate uptake regulator
VISETVRKFIGLETIRSTETEITLQSLLDPDTVSVKQSTVQLEQVARSMHADAITALLEGEYDLADHVIDRDDQVDRLYAMVSRHFQRSLVSPREPMELDLSQAELYDYQTTARQLERVADHASKIAANAQTLDAPPEDVASELQQLHEAADTVIEQAMDAMLADDSEEATRIATEAHEAVTAVDDHVREADTLLLDLEPQQAQLLGLVVDSLSRAGDYGGNIAESALQKAAPKP